MGSGSPASASDCQADLGEDMPSLWASAFSPAKWGWFQSEPEGVTVRRGGELTGGEAPSRLTRAQPYPSESAHSVKFRSPIVTVTADIYSVLCIFQSLYGYKFTEFSQ